MIWGYPYFWNHPYIYIYVYKNGNYKHQQASTRSPSRLSGFFSRIKTDKIFQGRIPVATFRLSAKTHGRKTQDMVVLFGGLVCHSAREHIWNFGLKTCNRCDRSQLKTELTNNVSLNVPQVFQQGFLVSKTLSLTSFFLVATFFP